MLRHVPVLVLHGVVLGHHGVLLHRVRLRVHWSLALHRPVLHGAALVPSHAHATLLHRHALRLAHMDIWHLSLHAHHLVLLHNEMRHGLLLVGRPLLLLMLHKLLLLQARLLQLHLLLLLLRHATHRAHIESLVMMRELLPGGGLLLHEYVAPLGRVLARVVGERPRLRGRGPTHAHRALRRAPAGTHAGAHEPRLVLGRRGPHLLLLRAQHLLLLLLQHLRLLLPRYTRCCHTEWWAALLRALLLRALRPRSHRLREVDALRLGY